MDDIDRSSPHGTARFIAVTKGPVEAIARRVFDFHPVGRHNLPEPPFILAANHLSFIDPVFVTLAVGANVRYLAVADLFDQGPLLDRIISFFGAIPTPRDKVPIAAVRTAMYELRAGRRVGLFPEGRRASEWRETAPRNGAAWLALKCDVPLVPVALVGTEGTLGVIQTAFRRTAIGVWIEPPLMPDWFRHEQDPVGAMSQEWHRVMSDRLDPWWGTVAGPDRDGIERDDIA